MRVLSAMLLLAAVMLVGSDVQAGESLRIEPVKDPLRPPKESFATYDPVNTNSLRHWATQGDAEAQFRLAQCLDLGRNGFNRNPVEAYKWAELASTQGHVGASNLVRQIELFLSPDQLTAAKAAAAAFVPEKELRKSRE